MKHDIDFYSDYCRRCGAGRVHIANGERSLECVKEDNVVGISHVISQRFFARITDKVWEHF